METKKQIIYSLEEIDHVVHELIALMKFCKIFTFTGSLGAGKTTLIRALLQAKGVTEPITSPTFTYVNVYTNESGERFNHFDLYRIDHINDFLAAGFDEMLYTPKTWTFIEWPAVIEPLLSSGVCHIELEHIPGNKRVMKYKVSREGQVKG